MRKLIYIFFIISTINFSAEIGGVQYYSDGYDDIGYGTYLRIGLARPSHIWRRYGENVDFTLNRVRLLTLGSEGTRRSFWITGVFSIESPKDINVVMSNVSFERTDGYIGNNTDIDFTQLGRNKVGGLGFPIIKSNIKEYARHQRVTLFADVQVNIPWEIQDGRYTLRSVIGSGDVAWQNEFSEGIKKFTMSSYRKDVAYLILTYLDVSIDSSISFGKVVFSPGIKEQTRRGNITIKGSPGTRMTLVVDNPKIYLNKVGGGKETVPVTVKLIDERNFSKEKIVTTLTRENKGIKELQFEASVNPGLYSGIPEGRYNGTARFKITYN